jgi:hypothetical protein
MELTVCNFAKSRLETIYVDFNENNTTWFEDNEKNSGIRTLTDHQQGLLICEYSYNYPKLIYGITRNDIGNSVQKALELIEAETEGSLS